MISDWLSGFFGEAKNLKMSAQSEKILRKFFRPEDHPYQIFEKRISSFLREDFTLLDAGCGRSAQLISKFVGRAKRLIGVEIIDFDPEARKDGIELLNNDLSKIDLESETVDLVISRSVLEHIREIKPVYAEVYRVLKRGGQFMFLVPNLGDYTSMISFIIPNRFHSVIVSKTEGRDPRDTFPTFYKSNTSFAVRRLAKATGFKVISIDYLGQYPAMLMFNPVLFFLGTVYEKIISRVNLLRFLRGWILVVLQKK